MQQLRLDDRQVVRMVAKVKSYYAQPENSVSLAGINCLYGGFIYRNYGILVGWTWDHDFADNELVVVVLDTEDEFLKKYPVIERHPNLLVDDSGLKS